MVRKSGRVKISSRDRVAVGNILLRGKVGGGRVAVAAAEEAEAGDVDAGATAAPAELHPVTVSCCFYF